MFDARIRPIIDPPLNRAGRRLAEAGVTADAVTWAGFALGMAACVLAAFELYLLSLVLVLVSRAADGLDGAVARATERSDRGGFLDIVLDFIFYGAMPLAFAWADPRANALAAATLLLAYFANGSAFLAFAIMAAKRGVETRAQGDKSLYYLAGLAEGFETILFTILICVFPSHFALLAYVYAAIVALSAVSRIVIASKALR